MAMCMSHIFDSKSLNNHDCLDGAGGFSSMETGINSSVDFAGVDSCPLTTPFFDRDVDADVDAFVEVDGAFDVEVVCPDVISSSMISSPESR